MGKLFTVPETLKLKLASNPDLDTPEKVRTCSAVEKKTVWDRTGLRMSDLGGSSLWQAPKLRRTPRALPRYKVRTSQRGWSLRGFIEMGS
jgi:hypothetical protein